MTDETILEKIGMQNADDATKQATLDIIKDTVEIRLMSIVSDLVSEEQVNHLEEMEKNGESRDAMFSYLSEQLTNLEELYNGALGDYIEEFIAKQKQLGI